MVAKIYVTGGIGESFWYLFAFDRDPASSDATSTEELIRIMRDAHAAGNLEAIECTIASCPGGDAIMGIEMHDILRTQGVPVTTRAVGLCASAGGVIFAAGDVRIATPGAMFLPHQVTGYGGGKAKDLQDTADTVRMLDNQIATAYATASGKTVEYWAAVMESEKMLNAQEMLAHGLVTSIENVVPLNHANIQKDMKINFSSLMDMLRSARNTLTSTNDVPSVTNEMIDTDKGMIEVNGAIAVGASVTLDGQPFTGKCRPKNGNPAAFEAENGTITIVIEEESEDPEEEPMMDNSTNEVLAELANSFKAMSEAFTAQAEAQKAQNEALVSRLEALETAAQNSIAQAPKGSPTWPTNRIPVSGAENTQPANAAPKVTVAEKASEIFKQLNK